MSINIVRRYFPASIRELSETQVEVVISTSALAADGDIWMTEGVDLSRYRSNPVWLWDHQPREPVGRAEEIAIDGDAIRALVEFAPPGISAEADKVRGLVKARMINGVSAGALPLQVEPLDPAKPRGGQRWLRWELYECSFCTVPSNQEARVTARAAKAADWKVGAARNLSIEDSDEWDGAAAEASIFEHAGGDEFDSAKARKGFLFYNAAEPDKRSSYKDPIAHVVDGELKVPKGAIRAAAGRLPQTDVPDDVKASAGKVLDHYKEKAGMNEDKDKSGDRRVSDLRRCVLVTTPKLHLRDLYGVAQLAYLLDQLGYAHSCNAWEAEVEADDSKVPAMIGEAMQAAGKALVAMTAEEVAELLDGHGIEGDDGDDALPGAERNFVLAAPEGRRRLWRRGIAHMRMLATRAVGDGDGKTLQDAAEHHTRALERNGNTRSHLDTVGDAHEALADAHTRAQAAHDRMGDAIEAANGSPPADVAEHIAKVQNQHRSLGKHLDAIGEQRSALAEAHSNATNTAGLCHRSIRAAQRCVRSLLDTDDGAAASLPQDAEGTAAARSADNDFRRRQVAVLELANAP